MTAFLVRVELHGADAGGQMSLDGRMEGAGFGRVIRGASHAGYALPVGEYLIAGRYGIGQVREMARAAAGRGATPFPVLVTAVAMQVFSGLWKA